MEENETLQNSINKPAGTPRGGIPEDILALINSDNTSLKIAEICLGHGIEDEETVKKIGSETAKVLIGRIPPKDFEKGLKEQLGLSSFLASKIAREISESIFYPAKESLTTLYGDGASFFEEAPTESPEIMEKISEETKRGGKDTYREPVE